MATKSKFKTFVYFFTQDEVEDAWDIAEDIVNDLKAMHDFSKAVPTTKTRNIGKLKIPTYAEAFYFFNVPVNNDKPDWDKEFNPSDMYSFRDLSSDGILTGKIYLKKDAQKSLYKDHIVVAVPAVSTQPV